LQGLISLFRSFEVKLKDKLQDYTLPEFRALVEKIERVDCSRHEHDSLVNHFDQIVQHPKGADLIFFPVEGDNRFGFSGVDQIIYSVEEWHRRNGQSPFADGNPPAQPPTPAAPPLTAAERAYRKSSANLAKVHKLAAQVSDAQRNVDHTLAKLEDLLTAFAPEPEAQPDTLFSRAAYASLESILADLEAGQHAVSQCVRRHDFLKTTVQFAKNDAERSLSAPHLDKPLQADILQQVTVISGQYHAQHADISTRYRRLHPLTQAAIAAVEADLIRIASASGFGPLKEANYFSSTLAGLDSLPLILTTYSNTSKAFLQVSADFQIALRSAVAGLAWDSISEAANAPTLYASVMSFEFDRAGCGEPFALSVPLAEIAATEGRDWQHLATTNARVDLPYRVALGVTKSHARRTFKDVPEVTDETDIKVVKTSPRGVLSGVLVGAAVWDAVARGYRFSRSGYPLSTVVWSGGAPLAGALSSVSQAERPTSPSFIGPVNVPMVEAASSTEDMTFDDHIVVFPEGSGISPIYLTFKSAREYAGAASGSGLALGDDWPGHEGAPVPLWVADQLRGKVFKRFSLFRQAFWRAVGSSPELCVQFAQDDVTAMQRGNTPYAPFRRGHPQPGRLEISYIIPPEEGGGVYDMDNMRVIEQSSDMW
jgi:hypothetical protein